MTAWAIMLKDLRLITRDRSALVLLLLVPMVVIWIVAATQSGDGTHSIVLPVVNEDQGPIASALIGVLRKHLDVREVTRPVAERWVGVENQAPAALILPGGTSKRYLTAKPSTIELLTDPAQWTALEAIKVILLLADREAASLGDPLHEELLTVQERSLTGSRLSLSSLEQNIPGFSLMFVLLNLVFSVSVGLSVVFLLAALGGLWWPFYDQPPWMRTIARGAMTTWSMFAIQDVMLRDKGWSEVAPTVLLLIVYGSVSFALGLRLFRYGERGASRTRWRAHGI